MNFELTGVSLRAGDKILLDTLSLELPKGTTIGLIGHNGSGKSTLLKILANQVRPSEGRILFQGKALPNWGARELARKIAYLPQQMPSTSGMLVRELVAMGRYPWHGALGSFGIVDRDKVEEAIVLTDTGPLANRLVDTLSGGERQRVWLAMLVAQDAQCLLLDEPTSALDIAHQIEVLSLVQRLSKERGLSVVLVLHDVNMAARFCDDIIALHSAKMISRGRPENIITPQMLQRIYGLPMEVLVHPTTGHAVAVAS
ncbi:ATP-binding cassette domain-containing protein [Agrobacterium rubi]|uniref:Putative ABC transporter ATP-binding protein n=1 Tax=Agrobacterium rubi TR3 = NBRC 13261 TaxID=1368415 RepID=A0A081D2W9_9HYPH|nr:ATP-binding cassette domain-containing protein [Agrobacterium rubi]MBP1881501.1 iron complex transport system ATP-binding protein [Agrobacterium rubi]MCL6654509.1 iron-hydroxamate transporter ATP-binding subunit [Agrobacterium rubi]NTF09319.1 ATP-binding cassette domain-containing protein [Agrobacterium rubi]NTF22229.1 ATP-binding cassette domain-containing protein [Agrobacterium rubi]NTF29086.1 ATP-binding cassette domain-containing protein [Agrobacterium rubi]